ncbi:MAG: hypothetical protein FWB79_04010, partial [Treponema sp.]|nr:hypothetical protein [Treponema sp.]
MPTYNDLPPEAGPAQEELDRLDAAMARATGARENAVAVQASVHFPDEWARAETDYQAGRRAGRATQEAVDQAVSYFMAAADLYELMAENGAEIFARDLEDARNALDAAITRARRSRQGALDAQGPTHFPGDWQSAEAGFQRAEAGERDTLAGVGATTALYVAAAADFDDIAARSRPIQAAARNEANNALREATARADGSRRAAMAVEGQVHFPSEWREAESQNQAGRRGRRTNPDEIMAAVALLNSAADGFDDIAGRSAPMAAAAMNDANREFQAAAARADRSRRAAVAVDAQTHFPGEWDRAESQNTGGRSAPRTTIAETRAATAQLNSAADGFDGMAERSGPMQARARDEANAAFQAALARADGSRQAAVAVEAQTFFPAEWRTADSQNTAARRGRRTTPEEIRNATAQLNSAADGFDDIARRSRPMFTAERNQADGALRAAMARATQSRQRAEETDAATNLPREWRNLETRHRNAENARRATLAEMRSAANLFNGVADGFDGIIQQNVR